MQNIHNTAKELSGVKDSLLNVILAVTTHNFQLMINHFLLVFLCTNCKKKKYLLNVNCKGLRFILIFYSASI